MQFLNRQPAKNNNKLEFYIPSKPETTTAAEDAWRMAAEEQWRQHRETAALLGLANVQIDDMLMRMDEQEKKIRELESLAATDPLTGLMNRRGFEKFIAIETARIERGGSEGAVLLLFDLDRFKEINDTHGHAAGDACLKKVAEYLGGTIRILDGAARLGGDEFAVLLTDTTQVKAQARIDSIRAALRAVKVDFNGAMLSFGVSLGLSEFPPCTTYDQAYADADRDLYRAKRTAADKGV
jgi:diguanylate cyclase (GGDEF)-like protein